MKITFVYPDYESLGVEYLMAACLKAGHEVDFIFYQAQNMYIGNKIRAVPFSNIAKRIADTRPHLVAFSCVTNIYQEQLSCAKALKEIMPDVVTVFGGIHTTAVPEIVLREKAVDCIGIGEAENSFTNFLKECKVDKKCILPGSRPIKGMVYKEEGRFIGDFKEGELPSLNTLSFPYKKPLYSRFKFFSREYFIIASRGCPYSCTYCFNSYMRHLRDTGIIRYRTVDDVIAELLQAKSDYAPKYIVFVDDCFTANEAWLIEFLQRYKKEICIPFTCITIPQYLNKEKIKALGSSGCYRVQIGIQSLNKELCDAILQRRCDKARTAEIICMLRAAGMMVQVDHMLGIPGDTLEIEEEAALFYNQFRPHVISVFWLTYYPKTPIIDIAKQKGILSAQDIENINEGHAFTERSFHAGGSMKDPRPYYGICLLFNCIPLLPKWLVKYLLKQKTYRKISINNYFTLVGFPRFLLAILNRKNFIDRGYLVRFINKIFSHELC